MISKDIYITRLGVWLLWDAWHFIFVCEAFDFLGL
jgi:hypothetical protein